MARSKTYQTSIGFFDLAIAAPSMKAAAEAWGSNANVFHQGFAKETDDPAIAGATRAKPGIVLRRPVGSNASFSEHAELPHLPTDEWRAKPRPKRKEPPVHKLDDKAAREAALAFERESRSDVTARVGGKRPRGRRGGSGRRRQSQRPKDCL